MLILLRTYQLKVVSLLTGANAPIYELCECLVKFPLASRSYARLQAGDSRARSCPGR